jgi:DNA replication and repair protein RecF
MTGGVAVSQSVAAEGRQAVRLLRLAVRDFRNLADVSLEIPNEGLALIGDNGHGKTNLLEATYYLHLFRSMRGARDRELARFGTAGFHIAAHVGNGRWDRIGVGVDRESGGRRIVLDGVPSPRLSDALGALPSVVIAPSDVTLVSGGPAARRHWIDVTLASTSPSYLTALREYRAALTQRNASLKARTRASPPGIWEPALAGHGAVLRIARAEFLAWSAERAADTSRALGERGHYEIRYRGGVGVDAGSTREAVRDRIAAALAADRERDIERGMTQHGPHRDDLDLRLDGVSLRRYGSAGQQRTAAIGLRLLEGEWYRERGGADPILLLDDPVAELDRTRAARVLERLMASGAGQVLLAVPREDDIPGAFANLCRSHVREGTVTSPRRQHA